MNQNHLLLLLTVLVSCSFIASSATASPWTVPSDELVLTLSQDFQFADQEYLPEGTQQAYPLNAAFRSQTTRVGVRYGFTDRFEGAADLNFSLVNYSTDTLVMEEFPDGATPAQATDAILDFNSSEFGAGDFRFHARYNFLRSALLITSSTTLKLPTGYAPPTGTFVTADEGERIIGGQATLGDGQTDLTQKILLGTFISATDTFMRLDAGLRIRFGAPGHQFLADFRAGQFVGEYFIITGGVGWTQTSTEGDIIGESFIARDPSVAASEFTGDNVEVIDLRLDRDALHIDGGVLLSIGDIEFALTYGHTLIGANTAAIHSLSLGAIFSFPDISGS